MALVFQNPLFLYGAAASAIPIAIHLINRRRAKPRKFPSITLIMESHKKTARHYRIRQRLLLALRVLAIASLAFFLAGPRVVSRAELKAGSVRKDTAMVIIIDNSFSMNYQAPQGAYMELARRLAGELTKELHPGARFAAVPLISEGNAPWDMTPDQESALRALSEIKVSYQPSDMTAALNRAYASLKNLPEEYAKAILVITDMTRTPWKGFDAAALSLVDRGVELKVVGLRKGREDYNSYVKSVAVGGATLSVPVAIDAELEGAPTGSVDPMRVELQVSGATIQRKFLKAPAEKLSSVQFQYVPREEGYNEAKLSISEDRLPEDNVYYFTIPARGKVKALVVDGDPKTSLLNSETYYLTSAIRPGSDADASPLTPAVATVGEFNQMGPYRADVIILTNVAKIAEKAQEQLLDYVLTGGNLIFFLGDKVDTAEYNRIFHDSKTRLLPARLGEAAGAPARLWRISQVDLSHPALAPFKGKEGESLLSAQFNRVVQVEPNTTDLTTRVLLALDNGAPLLFERKTGRGKVMLFTSTADRDWNDLATRGAYLPLIQGLVRYLTFDNLQFPTTAGIAGRSVEVPLRESGIGSSVNVAAPDGSTVQAGVSKGGDVATLHFTGATPGFYKVLLPGGSRTLALNASTEESDLSPISEEELRSKFGELRVHLVTAPASAADVLKGEGETVQLSSALALIMFMFLAAEAFMSNKT